MSHELQEGPGDVPGVEPRPIFKALKIDLNNGKGLRMNKKIKK